MTGTEYKHKSGCTISVVQELSDTLLQQWHQLYKAGLTYSPFLNPKIVFAWHTSYLNYIEKLLIITVNQENDDLQLVGLLPLYLHTNESIYLVGTGPDEIGGACFENVDLLLVPDMSAKAEQLIFYEIFEELKSSIDFSCLVLEGIKEDNRLFRFITSTNKNRLEYLQQLQGYEYTAELPMTETKKQSVKRKLGRYEKVLHKNINLRFDVVIDKETQLGWLPDLISLHNQRWDKSGKLGAYTDERFAKFTREIIKSEDVETIISGIWYKNVPVVLHLFIRAYNHIYFYQSGIDLSFKPNIRAGILAHKMTMEWCEKNSVDKYNLMRSNSEHSYKKGLTSTSHLMYEIKVFASSLGKYRYQIQCFWNRIIKTLNKRQ